jgi:DNA-binding MarR family transcriptional regulator
MVGFGTDETHRVSILGGGKMKAKARVGRESELWTLLNQAQHAAIRASETELRQLGVPQMHAEVLMIVKGDGGPVTPAEISRFLFREPHTISGLLTRMEKQGLVKRVRDLQRKNMVRIAITDKGEKAYRKLGDVSAITSIMSCLSSKEQDILKDTLLKLRRKALEELRMRQPLPYP